MAQQAHIAKVTQEPEATVACRMQIPVDLWKRLRNCATEDRTSAQNIWFVALEQYLAGRGF